MACEEKSSSTWLSLGWASGKIGKTEQDESGDTAQTPTGKHLLKRDKERSTDPRQAGVERGAVEAKIRKMVMYGERK